MIFFGVEHRCWVFPIFKAHSHTVFINRALVLVLVTKGIRLFTKGELVSGKQVKERCARKIKPGITHRMACREPSNFGSREDRLL